jgi:8-oxo-dGTP pyrophosphatase MutT (NUDIX family)
MRHVSAAFAWIERETPSGSRVLTQWNRKWQAFNLVGGHVELGETFRACVVREMVEELGIDASQFDVEPDPLARIEFEAFSVPAQETTVYQMAAFRADICTEAAWRRIDENPENRWLRAADLAAGATADGHRVSEVAVRFCAAIHPR